MTKLVATLTDLWIFAHQNDYEGKSPIDGVVEQAKRRLGADVDIRSISAHQIVFAGESLDAERVRQTVYAILREVNTRNPEKVVFFSSDVPTGDGATDDPATAEPAAAEPPKEGMEVMAELMRRINTMRYNLQRHIKGQQHAINAFTGGYFGMEMLADANKKRKGPRGIFLFAGPPGVGKTYMAELATQGTDIPFLRVDMSEFAGQESTNNFNGIHSSYKNAHPGIVTEFVDKNPKSLILFDEIEKASPEIIHLFLQILDAGTLRDMMWEREISFKDTIIILTTNAGHNLYEDPTKTNLSGISPKTVLNALRNDINPKTGQPYFPAAIVSRLATGTVIMFNHLEPAALCDIIANEINETVEILSKTYHLKIGMNEKIIAAIVLYREGGKSDARSLKAAARNFVRQELLYLFSQCKADDSGEAFTRLEEIRFDIDLSEAPEEAKKLFYAPSDLKVLVFCSEEKQALIAKQKAKGIEYVFTSNVDSAKSILRGDIAFAIVDVTCNCVASDLQPCDLEDLDSDGITVFRFLREHYDELPVFILNPDEVDSDINTYNSFIAAGARDKVDFIASQPEKFAEFSAKLSESAMISNSAHSLARSNKVLVYNSAQRFLESGRMAEIRLRRFAVKRAVDAEDSATVLDRALPQTLTFDDVIGAKDAKDSLRYFINYLKNPKSYLAKGVRPPRGVLLYGAPGTGKTLLARALAGESDVAFIQKNGTEFFKRYVGEGPQSIRDVFSTARRYAPAIIFIDEVDSFAKIRTGGAGDEHAAELLNTFLSEMDGFAYDEKRPVFVLVATNYGIDAHRGGAKVLDPAFVRRFDRKIEIGLPDTDEREQFIRMYLKKHGVDTISDSAIRSLAVRSYGRSPADLEMVIEYAVRSAGTEPLTDAILEKSLDADQYGEERKWNAETVKQTSYHEAGHTLVSWLCGKKPSYVTNISRGGFGGYMLPEIDDTRFGETEQEIENDICCSLAGRAAEIVVYGRDRGNSTGASSDLARATARAKQLLCTYCMEDEFMVSMDELDFNGEIGKMLYQRINEIVRTQFERAKRLLSENRSALDALTERLLEKNSLNQDEILETLAPFAKQ